MRGGRGGECGGVALGTPSVDPPHPPTCTHPPTHPCRPEAGVDRHGAGGLRNHAGGVEGRAGGRAGVGGLAGGGAGGGHATGCRGGRGGGSRFCRPACTRARPFPSLTHSPTHSLALRWTPPRPWWRRGMSPLEWSLSSSTCAGVRHLPPPCLAVVLSFFPPPSFRSSFLLFGRRVLAPFAARAPSTCTATPPCHPHRPHSPPPPPPPPPQLRAHGQGGGHLRGKLRLRGQRV